MIREDINLKRRSLCVNALARALDITPAAMSQHLRVLRDADIVIADKQGCFVHDRVNGATLAGWRKTTQNLLNAKDDRPDRSFFYFMDK